jgi:hypothetical protein
MVTVIGGRRSITGDRVPGRGARVRAARAGLNAYGARVLTRRGSAARRLVFE